MTLRKKSRQSLSKIQRAIWPLCRALVERRDADKDGNVFCYTCDAGPLVGANKQLGHIPWPKAVLGAFLKYDERVLAFQCFRCNIHFGGMGAEAYKRLKAQHGQRWINQLEKDRRVTVKAIDHYGRLLEQYRLYVYGSTI